MKNAIRVAGIMDKITLLITLGLTIYYIYEGEAMLALLAFIAHGVWCISMGVIELICITKEQQK